MRPGGSLQCRASYAPTTIATVTNGSCKWRERPLEGGRSYTAALATVHRTATRRRGGVTVICGSGHTPSWLVLDGSSPKTSPSATWRVPGSWASAGQSRLIRAATAPCPLRARTSSSRRSEGPRRTGVQPSRPARRDAQVRQIAARSGGRGTGGGEQAPKQPRTRPKSRHSTGPRCGEKGGTPEKQQRLPGI